MEQITLKIQDKTKAEWLIHLLDELDFVEITHITRPNEEDEVSEGTEPDFFALTGIWKDRDVTLESIRKRA